VIENIDQWISPRLKIKFVLGENELEIYHPNGEKFVSFVELHTQKQLAERKAKLAQEQAQIAEDVFTSGTHIATEVYSKELTR